MRNRVNWLSCVVGLCLSWACSAQPADLWSVYQAAVVNDPAFKKAQADWLTAKQEFPLALTGNGTPGSGLFPNVLVTAGSNLVNQHQYEGLAKGKQKFDQDGYGVSVTQPLFNLSTWLAIKSARFSVKAATATYFAHLQDLIRRVAFAYFEVLRAFDHWQLGVAQQDQFAQQWRSAQEKYRVGIIAITGVLDAKARYDKAVADEIQYRQQVQDRLEELRAITGQEYAELHSLRGQLPLYTPAPNRVDAWVTKALEQNYRLQADLNRLMMQRETVKSAAMANLPSLNFVGSYSENWAGAIYQSPFSNNAPLTHYQQNVAGLTLSFPVLQGGHTLANTKRERYRYLSISDQLEWDRRLVERDTRQAFWALAASIGEVKADEQTILSAQKQLRATRAGYEVGTRTMVDILDSVTQLTQAQLALADDRYRYVESIITLKWQAGTLSPADLQQLTQWLGPTVKFAPPSLASLGARLPNAQREGNMDLLKLNTPSATDSRLTD